MDSIVNSEFLLDTKTASFLYHEYAEKMPIIDYHCHLDPKLIAVDYRFDNLGELMLGGDHYKWRAMRSFGIQEKYITGDAPYKEKFRAYAEMLEWAIGNPLYAWTHLELKRYFNIDEALTARNADEIFDRCTALLGTDGYSARGLIERSGVEVICTTDDPKDSLIWHKKIAESSFGTKVIPAFRPDKLMNIHKDTYADYVRSIGVSSYEEVKSWLRGRIEFFGSYGCRLADHGLDRVPFAEGDPSAAFDKIMRGEKPTEAEADAYMTDLLSFCASLYSKYGWCMQLHFGPLRNTNSKMMELLGPDSGFDTISDTAPVERLALFMDKLEKDDILPKTILYSINGKDNYALAALMGCFQKAPFRSRIQLGSGWWFNDQRDGMEAQLRALGNLGILGCFVGMLTDSRSFVSYTRHEYFRRILCRLIGRMVEDGEYPRDTEMLGSIIRGICYENAKNYFDFDGGNMT